MGSVEVGREELRLRVGSGTKVLRRRKQWRRMRKRDVPRVKAMTKATIVKATMRPGWRVRTVIKGRS